jgi:hypothetical protein
MDFPPVLFRIMSKKERNNTNESTRVVDPILYYKSFILNYTSTDYLTYRLIQHSPGGGSQNWDTPDIVKPQ